MKDKKVIILKMMKVDRAVDKEGAKDNYPQEDRAGCSDHLEDHVWFVFVFVSIFVFAFVFEFVSAFIFADMFAFFLYLYFHFYLQEEDWAGSLNHLLDCTGGDGGHVDDQ